MRVTQFDVPEKYAYMNGFGTNFEYASPIPRILYRLNFC